MHPANTTKQWNNFDVQHHEPSFDRGIHSHPLSPPLSPWQQSVWRHPPTDLHRVVKVTIWVTAQVETERASLYSHQEKKQYQTPSRLHTVKTPTLKLHTQLYTQRVTSTQNKQSFKKLWLCKWSKTPQRKPRTKIINLSRADCSFASHSLATLWDAKTNSLDLHQQWLSAKIQ